MTRTYDNIGTKGVWVRQAGEGAWEKRMCTLQLCFSPDPTGPQPRPAIIFRGQGIKLSAYERAAWHKDVDVSFNESAWAKAEWCEEHIPKQLKPVVPGLKGGQALLLCDNLAGQCSTKFRKLMKDKHNILVWNLPPGTTDITQPVDSGYGRAVKRLIGVKLATWLENEANLEKWETGKITASERRILLTIWVAESVAEVNSDRATILKYWQRTGCLLTADGTRDDLVHLHPSMPKLPPLPKASPQDLKEVEDAKDDDDDDESASSGGIGLGLGESKRSGDKKQAHGKIKKEDTDNVKHDPDEPDLDEDDDIDDELIGASLRDALPKEFKIVERRPESDLNPVLIGSSFAMKWNVTGWCVGQFTKYYAKPKTSKLFNFETRYPGELRDHRFQLKDYNTNDDAPAGSWCLLRRPQDDIVEICS